MIIKPEHLETHWYEDEKWNRVPHDMNKVKEPEEARYYVSVKVLTVTDTYYKIVRQEDVDKCKHPKRYRRFDNGLMKGYKGRICDLCGGTQTRKWYEPWGKKWEKSGLIKFFTGNTHIGRGNADVIIAMVNSGDYDLQDAILVFAKSCERCMNVLLRKYLGEKEGYEEYSAEWFMCGTSCQFCQDDDTKPTKEVEEEIKKIRDEIGNRYKQREGSEVGECNCACEPVSKKIEKAFKQGRKIAKKVKV